jgi:hypothetical protein
MNPALPVTYFYGGTEKLVFDKEPWCWYKCESDGSRTPLYGVTNILKVIHKPQLLPWGIKVCLAKMRQMLVESHYVITKEIQETFPLYEDTLDEIIKEAKKTDAKILHDAGDVGTDAHEFLEEYGKLTIRKDETRRLELLAHFPADERAENCAIAGLEFFDRHNIRFLACERPVYSRSLKAVGTADGIVLADSCDDPACCPEYYRDSLTLLDYKTANGLYPSYLGQAAFYQQAYQEETCEHIERRFILKLPKDDGKFESWHAAGDDLFRQDLAIYTYALGLYQSLHAVEDRLDRIRDEARAIRKAAETKADDARQAVKCDKADDYQGVRKKKSCNGKDKMCQKCEEIYAGRHLQTNG